MHVDDDYIKYVLDQLDRMDGVSSRKMFGGAGIYKEKLMFGLIADNVFYLKVDDSNREDYTSRDSIQFKPWPEKKMMMPYFSVPEEIMEDKDELTTWAVKAFDVAVRTKKK